MGFAVNAAAWLVLHHDIDILVEAVEKAAKPIES